MKTSFCLLLFLPMGCSDNTGNNQTAPESTAQSQAPLDGLLLTDQEKSEGWELLFDGENLDHWRSVTSDTFPGGWEIEDGSLVLNGNGGNIITQEKYGNFELTWEFNLTEGANSGIKYFVDSISHRETGRVVMNGPEYQIIDDLNHPEIKDDPDGLSSTASVYLLYAPENKNLRPAGEWNQARIIAKDGQIEHWLNGTKVLAYEKGSEDFGRKVSGTKFKDYPDYGLASEGHILLTDHQDRVFFRNIRIRRL